MLPRSSLKTSTISLRIGHFKRQVQALPQQGRHREALPLTEKRGGDQARPRLDGGRRVRRPPHRLHRAAHDQFDTFFRKASETHVNEIHH